MVREIILVELVNGEDLNTHGSKAFVKTKDAEKYFCELAMKHVQGISDTDIEDGLDNGFIDYRYTLPDGNVVNRSIIIKEITFEDGVQDM